MALCRVIKGNGAAGNLIQKALAHAENKLGRAVRITYTVGDSHARMSEDMIELILKESIFRTAQSVQEHERIILTAVISDAWQRT